MGFKEYSLCALLALEACGHSYNARRVEVENSAFRCAVVYSEVVGKDAPRGSMLRGDFTCLSLEDRHFLIGGWYQDGSSNVTRMHYITGDIRRVNVCEKGIMDEQCELLLKIVK